MDATVLKHFCHSAELAAELDRAHVPVITLPADTLALPDALRLPDTLVNSGLAGLG